MLPNCLGQIHKVQRKIINYLFLLLFGSTSSSKLLYISRKKSRCIRIKRPVLLFTHVLNKTKFCGFGPTLILDTKISWTKKDLHIFQSLMIRHLQLQWEHGTFYMGKLLLVSPCSANLKYWKFIHWIENSTQSSCYLVILFFFQFMYMLLLILQIWSSDREPYGSSSCSLCTSWVDEH